jgi:hypothetical protein
MITTLTMEKQKMERNILQKKIEALEQLEKDIMVEIQETKQRIAILEYSIVSRQAEEILDGLYMDLDECFDRMMKINEKKYEVMVVLLKK